MKTNTVKLNATTRTTLLNYYNNSDNKVHKQITEKISEKGIMEPVELNELELTYIAYDLSQEIIKDVHLLNGKARIKTALREL
jgi:hypothetical protein